MPVGLHQATQACQDRTNQNRLYLTSNSHVLAASVELMCTRCSLSGNPKYKSSAPPLTCVTANVHWFTSTVIQTKQFLKKIKLKLNFLLSKMWLFSAGSRFQQAGPGWNATIILESNRLISLHSSLYLPRRWMWVKAAAQIVAPSDNFNGAQQRKQLPTSALNVLQRPAQWCETRHMLSLSPLNRQMHTLRDTSSVVMLHIMWDKWQY